MLNPSSRKSKTNEKSVAKIPELLVERIHSADRIVLLTHVRPDGDALGSSFGFADILRGLGKTVCVFLEEAVSPLYQFLPGCDSIVTDVGQIVEFTKESGACLTIALDAGDGNRLGITPEELKSLEPVLAIDHHKSHKDYGLGRWVDPTKSSTGEMIYELALKLGAEVSYAAAVNLYVAICTDTGSFRYDSTLPRTFQIASELVEKGVKPHDVSQCLHDNVSLQRIKLLKEVLETLKVYEDGKLAFVHVTGDMLDRSGASTDDLEGLVDYPRSLGSVKVAVFIKEIMEGEISVSLRAKGECDVAEVASRFKGGGHRNAAGFRFSDKTIDEVHLLVLNELSGTLKNSVE